MTGKTREGFLYGLAAYGWWGLVPLYFRALRQIAPLELLAHRIVWSLLFLALILSLGKRWPRLWSCFRDRAICRTLVLTSFLIAVNWFVYITAVEQELLVHASLGYFITPLVNVLLGMLFFKERLRRLQWLALLFAVAGTAILIWYEQTFPWIAFTLAGSFSLYGLFRKKIPVDGLVGLSAETIFLVPLSLGYLIYLGTQQTLALGAISVTVDVLILCSGIVTAIPLLCFGQAAQRLPLSTLGFLQYLAPSIQFLLAVALFGEAFDTRRVQGFVLTWIGLAIFTADSVRAFRKARLGKPLAA